MQNGDVEETPKNFHLHWIISFSIRIKHDDKIHLWVKRSVMDEIRYDFDTVQEAKERAQIIWNDFIYEYISRFFY